MPTYDYRCADNGRVVEVTHRMSERLSNWAELCAAAGIAPGDTPGHAAVERLATGGQIVGAGALRNPEAPPCASGGGCPGGSCGL